MNNAARQPACPSFLSGEAVPAEQTCSKTTLLAQAKDCTTGASALHPTAPSAAGLCAGTPAQSQQPSSAAQPAGSQGHPEGHTDSAQPSMAATGMTGLAEDGPPVAPPHKAHPQKPSQLREADIDWAGEDSAQPQGCGEADCDAEPEVDHAGWSDSDAEEYDPEAMPHPDDEFQEATRGGVAPAARRASARQRSGHTQKDLEQRHEARMSSCARNGVQAREGAASAVHDATLRFVKAILKPLFAAQVGLLSWSLRANCAVWLAHLTAWAMMLSNQ